MKTKRYSDPLPNKPINPYDPMLTPMIDKSLDISWLKVEISRVNQMLRENHNPHTYRQNKKYLERLERKLRLWKKTKK